MSCLIAASIQYQAAQAYETHDDARGQVPGESGVPRSVESATVERGLAVYAVDVERTLFVVKTSLLRRYGLLNWGGRRAW